MSCVVKSNRNKVVFDSSDDLSPEQEFFKSKIILELLKRDVKVHSLFDVEGKTTAVDVFKL
jgi:hypothetical protein